MSPETLDPAAFITDNRALLEALPVCAGIPFALFEPFFLQCEFRRLQPDEVLLTPGTPNHHLYLLLSGQIAIYVDFVGSDKTFEVPLGEFVGEVSIIDGLPPTGYVAAVTESVVLAIPEATLWSHYFLIPGAARNLLRQIARRMRDRNAAIQKAAEQTLRLELLEKELRIAHDLQASLLPVRPLLPMHAHVRVDALMLPAKEIGGDFYDAFPLDADTVCVAIGDVAGKGVPAALFMVRCITLLRTQMMQSRNLLQTVASLNALLCDDNPMCMFVTMLICLVDTRTGELEYINGGHNPAVLGNARDGFRFLPQPKGMLLGINPFARFESTRLAMDPGDVLVLYTDGITEAMSPAQEEFTDRRMLDHINARPGRAVSEFIGGLRDAVQAFAAGAEQSDDLTLLALAFKDD